MNLRKLNTIHYITNILNKANMKKKEYERPTMQVVQLKQTGMLMTSGQVNATMNGTWEEEDIWCPAAIRVLTIKQKKNNEYKDFESLEKGRL